MVTLSIAELATAWLVSLGSLAMLLSLVGMRRVLSMLDGSRRVRDWRLLFVLSTFFLVGYVATVLLIVTGRFASLFVLLTGVIFFAGAVFVYLVVRTGRLTMLDFDDRVAERTADLTDRTAELSRRTEQLGILNRAATQLGQCLSSDEILSLGLAVAGEAVALRSGIAWEMGKDNQLRLSSVLGMSDDARRSHESLPRSLDAGLADAFHSGQTMLIRPSEHVHDGLAAGADSRRPASVLVVPLRSPRTLVGVMALANPDDAPIGTEEIRLVDAIGAEMGLALENARRYDDARDLADRDSLTGLANHRSFHERLNQEIGRVCRSGEHGERLALIMMDLDRFKAINDTYGHPVGDRVLRHVAAVLAEHGRSCDVRARYGGDEFAVLLPNTETIGAAVMTERIRQALADCPFEVDGSAEIAIHVSFGIAIYPDDAQDASQLVASSDAHLYESKRRGGEGVTGGEQRSIQWIRSSASPAGTAELPQ